MVPGRFSGSQHKERDHRGRQGQELKCCCKFMSRRGCQFFTRVYWALRLQIARIVLLRNRHFEVCDEAEACGELVGARVRRRDEHRVENGCFASPGLPQAVDIGLFHLPWPADMLVGTAERFHNFGLNGRAGISQGQFATDSLVQGQVYQGFPSGLLSGKVHDSKRLFSQGKLGCHRR